MMETTEQRKARIARKVLEIKMTERITGTRLADIGCAIVAYAAPADRRAMMRIVEDFSGWEQEWAFREIGESASLVLDKIIEQRIAQYG